ncbi:MAG: peptidylprolyl isomerase [Chitinophagaceae bacterium]|nr:MAG: peptidylprolyl isomerase [Chitinophagaceae bacterium]
MFLKKRILFYLLPLLLFIFIQSPLKGQSFVADKIVAIVGNRIILDSDIELQFQQLKSQMDEEIPETFKCDLLEDLILEKLLLVQADRDSVEISDEEVDGEMERRLRYFISMIGSQERLEAYYGKSIEEIKEEFRGDIKDQLLASQLQRKIVRDVKVSPAEVKEFFNSIPADSLPYFNAEVEVGQIVIKPEVSTLQREMARERITEIRSRVAAGEDFGMLALLYSQDPGSAEKDGDLGFVERGQGLAPEFEGAAFRLGEGEVSGIVRTDFGYHIIKVNERLGDRIRLQHILIRPQITSFDLREAKEKLDTVRQKLVSGEISFNQAVIDYCQFERTRMNGGLFVNQESGDTFFELDQLDRPVFSAVSNLSAGEFSEPLLFESARGEKAYRIIYLKSETEAHVANLEQDYNKIQAAALNFKQQKEMARWMHSRMNDTYIKIDEKYQDCDNLKDKSSVTSRIK